MFFAFFKFDLFLLWIPYSVKSPKAIKKPDTVRLGKTYLQEFGNDNTMKQSFKAIAFRNTISERADFGTISECATSGQFWNEQKTSRNFSIK